MNDLLEFLNRLNEVIPPANIKHSLSPKHSVTLINDTVIEIHLYPVIGGQYHIPVEARDRSVNDVISEIEQQYQKCFIISGG